jgi:hypothetical protein
MNVDIWSGMRLKPDGEYRGLYNVVDNVLQTYALKNRVPMYNDGFTATLAPGVEPEAMWAIPEKMGYKPVQVRHRLVEETKEKATYEIFYIDNASGLQLSIDKEREVSVYTSGLDLKKMEAVLAAAKALTVPRKNQGKVYVMAQGMSGIEFTTIGKAPAKLVPTNYTRKVIEAYEHIQKEFANPEPCGRLVIFDGEMGTGKTHLVQALLDSVEEAMFVLVPPNMISQLSGPQLAPAFINLRNNNSQLKHSAPIVLILEDADEILLPRMTDNQSSISGVLNTADGILGTTLNLRLLATTNGKRIEMDPAIMRPGRLCRRVNVERLDRHEVVGCYKGITGKDFPGEIPPKSMTLAEIYQLAKHNGETIEVTNQKDEVGFKVEAKPERIILAGPGAPPTRGPTHL